jgi:hypothetical protein
MAARVESGKGLRRGTRPERPRVQPALEARAGLVGGKPESRPAAIEPAAGAAGDRGLGWVEIRRGGRKRLAAAGTWATARRRLQRAVERGVADEPEDLVASERGDVEAPAGVLSEADRLIDCDPLVAIARGLGKARAQRAEPALVDVGVQVSPIEIAQARVADDVAAGDRGRAGGWIRVGEDRVCERAGTRDAS